MGFALKDALVDASKQKSTEPSLEVGSVFTGKRELGDLPRALSIKDAISVENGSTQDGQRPNGRSTQEMKDLKGLEIGFFSFRLSEEVRFGSGSTVLDLAAKSGLDGLAMHLSAIKRIYDSAKVEFPVIKLHGNTDLEGSESQNMQVSKARAESVESYLRKKVPGLKLEVYAHGESLARDCDHFTSNERNVTIEALRKSEKFKIEDKEKLELLVAGRENIKILHTLAVVSRDAWADYEPGAIDITAGGTKIPANLRGQDLSDKLRDLKSDNETRQKFLDSLLRFRSEGTY